MNLFVYGSLMFQEILAGLSDWNGTRFPARLDGWSCRRIKGASYPGLVPAGRGVPAGGGGVQVKPGCHDPAEPDHPAGQARGMLLMDLPEHLLQKLDVFEGPSYRRLPVMVEPRMHSQPSPCVPAEPGRTVPGGPGDPAQAGPGSLQNPGTLPAEITRTKGGGSVQAWTYVWNGPPDQVTDQEWHARDFRPDPRDFPGLGFGSGGAPDPGTRRYWLMKSEPSEVSVQDLASSPGRRIGWFGVRNYQARNYLRDLMKPGDLAFFYHSSCPRPGIAGISCIATAPYPDPTQFDPESKYFDPRAKTEAPRWFQVDVELVREVPLLDLSDIRAEPGLEGLRILQKGNRLSITPVEAPDWYLLEGMILERELNG